MSIVYSDKGIKINADTLQFGTAKDGEGNTALALIMHSETTHIDHIHVINSKEPSKTSEIQSIRYSTRQLPKWLKALTSK